MQLILEYLNGLMALHESLFELSMQKKEVLTRNQAENLPSIVKQETVLIKQIAVLDKKLAGASESYLQSKGLSPNQPVQISDLLKAASLEEKERLAAGQQQLLDTMNRLKEINQTNQNLIRQSLDFIDFSLGLFTGAKDEVVYQRPSEAKKETVGKRVFDTKA